ncbi:TonB-dependent receptor (plasmid) [Novosphingobium sp. PP1Y]|nr:TonB-dependent receptor [Novosphingobium sp. PP1Y]
MHRGARYVQTRAQLLTGLSALALGLFPLAAHAQDATKGDTAENADVAGSEIVVTGTSIRGVAPVGSSLIAIGSEQLENSPSVSTADILKEMPQIFNYGVSDASRTGAGGAGNIVYGNAINLRGVSPYATLTLINGRRAVPQGTTGATVDPSTIPALALERIEVIADGASAIYGSDAVTGVANLIMKRGYDGLKVNTRYGMADDYHNFQIGGIAGHTWDSGQVTLTFQHLFKSSLSGMDRDFYAADQTSRGGADYREVQCAPGNIVAGGQNYAIPEGGATPTNLIAGTQNRCDNVKLGDLLPQQENNAIALTFDQEVTDGIKIFADAYANRRDGLRMSPPATTNLTVPSSNYYFVAPAGAVLSPCPASAKAPAGALCETVQYSFANDGRQNTSKIVSKTIQGTLGLDAELFSDFHLNAYGTYGYNHDHVYSRGGNINNANIVAALASSDPATAFNPFATGVNDPAVLSSIFDNLTDTDGRSKFTNFKAAVDGTLFTLPGGPVKIAVGAEYFKLKLRTGQIRGAAGAQTGTDQRLGRNVKSAYGELLIPIFGPDNAMPGFQSLTLDIAGRIDKYSDVGSTKNPKFGFNWEPINDFKIHGSYGKSFRAPELTRLVSAGGSQLFIQSYYDPTASNGAGATILGVALSGGNLDLQPETSRTYSLGFDYTPAWKPGARLGINYFDLVYKGQINGFLSNRNVLRQEDQFTSIILRGAAAQARIADLVSQGYRVNGGTTQTALDSVVFVDGRPSNQGTTITRGIDFNLSVPFDVGADGKVRVTLGGIRFFTYKSALTPTSDLIEQVNNIDYPLKLRMRGSLDYSNDWLSAGVTVNYANGYNNTLFSPAERIKAYTTIDAQLSFDLGKTGIYGTEGIRLGIDVQNLFDQDPPYVDIAPIGNGGGGGFDAQVANPIGRLVSFSLSKEF